MYGEVVAFGEILWDLLPDGPVLGGAPLNFAYRCSALGLGVTMVSRVGDDDLGERAVDQMRSLGLNLDLVQRDPTRPTGTVPVVLSETGEPSYTIVRDVAYDCIELPRDVEDVLRGTECVYFGTVAQRGPVSRATLRALLDSFHGRYRLLDINLRRDCFDEAGVSASLERADIVKMNDQEISQVAAMAGLGGDSIPEMAAELVRAYGLSYCLVTLGARGSYALGARGEVAREGGYAVEVSDTCGSGDAFTAAFIREILRGGTLEGAVRAGNALGAMVATQKGATGAISLQELAEFMASHDPNPVLHL